MFFFINKTLIIYPKKKKKMYLIILVPYCILPIYSGDSLLSFWIKFPLLMGKKKKEKKKKKERKLREKSGIWHVIFLPLGFVACHMFFIGIKTWESWRNYNGRGALPKYLNTHYLINQLHLLFEYIEHKYTRTLSCPSSIRTPSLNSELKF